MIPDTGEALQVCGYEVYISAVCIDTLDSDHCVNTFKKKTLRTNTTHPCRWQRLVRVTSDHILPPHTPCDGEPNERCVTE